MNDPTGVLSDQTPAQPASCIHRKGNQLYVDLTPLGGPVIGPFSRRDGFRARLAEITWRVENQKGKE